MFELNEQVRYVTHPNHQIVDDHGNPLLKTGMLGVVLQIEQRDVPYYLVMFATWRHWYKSDRLQAV